MCTINPTHKRRFILDVYTSIPMGKEEFEERVLTIALDTELDLNLKNHFRWHLKESKEEAE